MITMVTIAPFTPRHPLTYFVAVRASLSQHQKWAITTDAIARLERCFAAKEKVKAASGAASTMT